MPGPKHGAHCGRGHCAAHTAHPPDRGQPSATGLRHRAAPHLDGGDRPNLGHRRRNCQRQRPDQVTAQSLRLAGARRRTGQKRPSRLGGSAKRGLAGGGETLRRQPRAWCVAGADAASGGGSGLPPSAPQRRRQCGDCGKVHPWPRAPPAGGGQKSGGRSAGRPALRAR